MELEVYPLPPPFSPRRALSPAKKLGKEVFFASERSSRVERGPVEADLSRNVERFRAPRHCFVEIDLPTPQGVYEVDRLNGPIETVEEKTRLLKSSSKLILEVRVARTPPDVSGSLA